jgi:hypothetical protein
LKVLIIGLAGLFGGGLFGFISYYLLTDVYRSNPLGLVLCAIQGLILGLCYSIISKLLEMCDFRKLNLSSNIVVGILSGLISSAPIILITVCNVYQKDVIIPEILSHKVSKGLILYSMGSMLIGAIVGIMSCGFVGMHKNK